MRRRGVLLGVPWGMLALGACARRGDIGSSARAPAVEGTAPVVLGERAEVVDHAELRLPLEMAPRIIVDPGWAAGPLELDGIFLGYRDEGDHLRFLAVDQDGTLLWRADRPLTCTGYALTRGEGGAPVAVLADSEPTEEAIAAMTLTAYDLRTADPLWGPVESPGAQVAIGLVYAAPSDQPMGQGGPRTALSGATGRPLLVEDDPAEGRILAESLGVVLRTAGTDAVASGADGDELWRIPLPAGIDPQRAHVTGTIDPSTSLAVLAGQEEAGTVIDLADGRVVAEDARAVARDHAREVVVVASGSTVRGLDADGIERWTHEEPGPLQLISAGECLAYVVRQADDALVVLDTNAGQMVQPYDPEGTDLDGPLAVPEMFSAGTAAAVRVDHRRFLVTTEFDEDVGRSA